MDEVSATRLGAAVTGSLRRSLAFGTIGTAALNVSTTLFNSVIAVVLARLLGADGYGGYAFALAWVAVLAVPASLGLPALVVRSVAAYTTRAEWGLLRGFLRRSNQLAAGGSVAVAAGAALVALLVERSGSDLLLPFLAAMPLVVIFSLNTVRQSALQGLGRVVVGRIPETLIVPLLFLALVTVAYAATGDDLSAARVVGLNVVAAAVALGVGAVILRRTLPREARSATPAYDMRLWRSSGVKLLVASLLSTMATQLGTILLGVFQGSSDAGVYSVAQRASLFVSFLWLAATYPLMPVVARLHASADERQLSGVLTRGGQVVLLASVPVALGLFVFAGLAMELFGSDFGSGADALRILILGEASNLLVGFAGLSLVMTGHEGALARVVAVRLAVTAALMLVLAPTWGVVGAATAATVGTVLSNGYLAWATRRRLGFDASPLHIRSRGRKPV